MSEVARFIEYDTVQVYVHETLFDMGWKYVGPSDLPRQTNEILVNEYLKKALIRLNTSIAEKPVRADEVIYRLRAIILSAHDIGLVRANEEFNAWIKGEKSMPFGENNQHVPIKLIDFNDIQNNDFIVTMEYTVKQKVEKRPDIICLINGIPMIVGECKTPVRPAISWLDAAIQISDDYEVNIPGLFVPNLFSFGTDGKEFRYATIRAPLEHWSPWRTIDGVISLEHLEIQLKDMFRPKVILDILNNFTVFATDRKNRKIKIICRHQQYEDAN